MVFSIENVMYVILSLSRKEIKTHQSSSCDISGLVRKVCGRKIFFGKYV